MPPEPQSERVAIRITPTEFEMLVELSTITGLNYTDFLRQAIRREFNERVVPLMGSPPGKTLPDRKTRPKAKKKTK